jgi:tRNA threonylcarbamoyladenosine biosynthesis protein TsaB
MLIAALDTTTRAGSMALLQDGRLLELAVGNAGRAHAERLPGDLLELMRRQGRQPRNIDVFAVAAGPGSFTGLRIGIATVQGLAFATNRPVVSVSALEALALSAVGAVEVRPDDQIGVWMDGQRGEVFSAIYRLAPPGTRPAGAKRVEAPAVALVEDGAVASPRATLERWCMSSRVGRLLFVGDGALAYRDAIVASLGPVVPIITPTPPLAPAIGAIAWRDATLGHTVPPHAIRPVYIRRPDAELARDRRSTA